MPRPLTIAAAVGAVALAAVAWLLSRPAGRAIDAGLTDSSGSSVQAPSASEQRAAWAQVLGIPADRVDFDGIERRAIEAGAPVDWEFGQGWPTPCGPASDPRRYCPDA